MPVVFVNHGGGPMPLLGQDDFTAANLRTSRCISQRLGAMDRIIFRIARRKCDNSALLLYYTFAR
jgi:hypothetical protein